MKDPVFVEQFREIRPFNLISHTGLARTHHGVVAFIVGQIAAHSPQGVMIEQFLNRHNIATIRAWGFSGQSDALQADCDQQPDRRDGGVCRFQECIWRLIYCCWVWRLRLDTSQKTETLKVYLSLQFTKGTGSKGH
jgi:hypothetical protein